MRILPEYLGSTSLYWVLNDLMMLTITISLFIQGKKSVVNMVFCCALVAFLLFNFFDDLWILLGLKNLGSEFWKYILLVSSSLCLYVLIFRKRYEWSKLKGSTYNKGKVQAIYSKPNDLVTLLGATTSFSPKCSVRYTYNGKMIRFKRGYPTPIMTNTIVKKSDIVEDTNINPECFYERFDEIKNKNYKILTFNCRHLFKDKKSLKLKYF